MATTTDVIKIDIDGAVRAEAAAVLAGMGLTVSDAIRLMLIKLAHDHALPFDPFIPNTETGAAMQEARFGGLQTSDTLEQFVDAMTT